MATFPEHFERQYQLHLKHLKLKGLQPKTIDAYARAMRRIGEHFASLWLGQEAACPWFPLSSKRVRFTKVGCI